MIGICISQFHIHGRDRTIRSLGQVNAHVSFSIDRCSLSPQPFHQIRSQSIVLLPVGCHRFHTLQYFRHRDVKASLVVILAVTAVPVQCDMAVCHVIADHGPGHIVQLHILSVPEHQYIIARGQQFVPQDLCHLQSNRSLRCPVLKCHASGHCRSFRSSRCRTASRSLGRTVRMAQRLYFGPTGGAMSRIHSDNDSLASGLLWCPV